jgi:hypothetical protein
MKASELRIGNYVNDSIGLITIGLNGNIKFADAYHPIPLTEEWLMKFGFEYTKIDLGFNQYRNKILELSITPNGYEIFFTYKWINIKYVHSLQNLYFALTNEEL